MNLWKLFLLACKAFTQTFQQPEKTLLLFHDKEKEKTKEEDNSHLRLLELLQKEGRLIDFIKEDISQFSDAQIGAAVRTVHRECAKSLEEFVTIRPLMQESEGAQVLVPQGYDTQAIKIVGKVKGNPPYQGILRHKGWKAHKHSLPKSTENKESAVICPAEIEIREAP